MYSAELARYRIDDMVREAERYRRSLEAMSTAWSSKRRVHRIAVAALSVVAWPFHR